MFMEAGIFGLVGVLLGGIITAFFQHHFSFKKELKERESIFREVRYKAIVLLMYTVVYPETISQVTIRRPEIKDTKDIHEELRIEFLNSLLFASNDVLKAFNSFLNQSSKENFVTTILAMRKDLWGRQTKLDNSIILKDNSALSAPPR